jgi:cell division protein FtsL
MQKACSKSEYKMKKTITLKTGLMLEEIDGTWLPVMEPQQEQTEPLVYEFPVTMPEQEPEPMIDPEELKRQNKISRLQMEAQFLEYGKTLLYIMLIAAIVLIVAFVWYCVKALSGQTETIGAFAGEAAGMVIYALIIVIGVIVAVSLLRFFIPRLLRAYDEEPETYTPTAQKADQQIRININQAAANGSVQDLINHRQ